jgi:hypothetical protein
MFTRDGALFTDLLFTNAANNINLLGVGWLARGGLTNESLFNVVAQDLITYSLPHDTLFRKATGKVVVGAYSFVVPPNAAPNDLYEITLGRASATSDGVGGPGGDVFIDMPTNGALGVGSINTIKHVVVGQRRYIVEMWRPSVGSMRVISGTRICSAMTSTDFQSAIYGMNNPPPGTDF